MSFSLSTGAKQQLCEHKAPKVHEANLSLIVYIWVDLDTFDTQVEQNTPRWETDQRDAFAKVMDEFHQYDNVAGFFIGNEAITTANGSVTAPYIKAAARDMKAYRDEKGYRSIPILYSAADIASLRPMLQNYLACGSNASERLDFFSLNAYSWCGQSTYQQSGYDQLEKNSEDLHIPIFMSETGCNTVKPRDFKDQEALFGEMSDVWSGSIIYEWIEEQNDYGLISYGPHVDPASPSAPPDGFPRSGTFFVAHSTHAFRLMTSAGKPTPVEPDFPNLSAVWATLNTTQQTRLSHAQTTLHRSGRLFLHRHFLRWVKSMTSTEPLHLRAPAQQRLEVPVRKSLAHLDLVEQKPLDLPPLVLLRTA